MGILNRTSGVAILCALLICILSAPTPGHAQDTWANEWIKTTAEDVDLTVDESDHRKATVNFDENNPKLFNIVQLFFTGNPPNITSVYAGGSLTSAEVFKIEPTGSGQANLVLLEETDYEITQSYTVILTLANSIKQILFNIRNINDNTPAIMDYQSNINVMENTVPEPKESIGNFTAEDADGAGDDLIFELTVEPSDAKDWFTIEHLPPSGRSRTGKLHLNHALDYESRAVYKLRVVASDGEYKSPESIIIVSVGDIGDQAPVWSSPPGVVTVSEGQTVNTVIFEVNAYDGDIDVNNNITYSITEGNDLANFEIDSSTGKVSLVKLLDYDAEDGTGTSYDLTIQAKEDDPNLDSSSTTVVNVLVTDENDNWPILTVDNAEISINENYALSLNQLGEIKVVDPDSANRGTFLLTLEPIDDGPNPNDAFFIIPGTGYQTATFTISVKDAYLLDYENELWRTPKFKIVATEVEDPTHKHDIDVIINLLDINDNAPVFQNEDANGGFQKEIPENATIGTEVITVQALDKDMNDTFGQDSIRYSLSQTGSAFAIDEMSGLITVNGRLDFLTQPVLTMQVRATDGGKQSTSVQLTVNLKDVNNVRPTITMPSVELKIYENTEPNTVFEEATITADDVDTDASLEFKINWDSSKANKRGALVDKATFDYTECFDLETSAEMTGKHVETKLKIGKVIPDWEKFDTMTLIIEVTDTNSWNPDQRTASGTMTIQILDTNDCYPNITSGFEDLQVPENANDGYFIGNILATDDDENSVITYSLVALGAQFDGLVKIEDKNGVGALSVSNGGGIDRELFDSMKYNVTASDSKLSSTIQISITVNDANDETPYFVEEVGEVTIPEGSPDGYLVATVQALDNDTQAPFNTVRYSFDSNTQDGPGYFDVNFTTGEIKVKLESTHTLDREVKEQFLIDIEARDNYRDTVLLSGSRAKSKRITVILSDVNDETPTFNDFDGILKTVVEDDETVVILDSDENLCAKDLDATEEGNSIISYSLLEGDASLFIVETNTITNCAVIKRNSLLSGHVKVHELVIEARDHGTPSLFSNKTFNIRVTDVNDNAPVFIYPLENTIEKIQQESVEGQVPLLSGTKDHIPTIEATDKDQGDNAEFTIRFTDDSSPSTYGDYFDLAEVDTVAHKYEIRLIKPLDVNLDPIFNLVLEAKDMGSPQKSTTTTMKLYVRADTEYQPIFEENEQMLNFTEGKDGLTESWLINSAYDENNANLLDGEVPDPMFYYLVGPNSNTTSMFSLVDRELKLNTTLDREESANHNLVVRVSSRDNQPPETNTIFSPDQKDLLNLNIQVNDIIDTTPTFIGNLSGGVSTDDSNGKVVLILSVSDPDLKDSVTYRMENDVKFSDSSLATVAQDRPFILDSVSGELKLNFDPQRDMTGFFSFTVTATDKAQLSVNESVKIYIINENDRVEFIFRNTLDEVTTKRDVLAGIMSDVFGYTCNIDDIKKAAMSDGTTSDNKTSVTEHFIDMANNNPVHSNVITGMLTNPATVDNLRKSCYAEGLNLDEVVTVTQTTSNTELVLGLLIGTSCLLAVLLLILLAVHCVKTRRLEKRVQALGATKFGSQESGLNRIGMAVPNTNKHAVEGSNPVWNVQGMDLDTQSQHSGDSDLIGVEDNPEFDNYKGHHNPTFQEDFPPEFTADLDDLPYEIGVTSTKKKRKPAPPPPYEEVTAPDVDPDFDKQLNSNFSFKPPDFDNLQKVEL